MSDKVVRLRYTGTAPGTDSNTYSLFDTTTAGIPRDWGQMADLHTFHLSVKHSQNVTFKGYRSLDGGTTWIQFYDSGVVAAPTYTTEIFQNIQGLRDFKFEAVNGGAAQATWNVHMDCSGYP